ncbi:MAG: DUF1365 domain-containing protein [Alcanivoracaceae bacterium]|jgi:DUF1365 family protein|nr:DUF1365 domain-containing protein [Alcanivoracaceae bacterium]
MITDHALYTGEVWHRRENPVVHAFSYPFWWLWLNLDDVDGLLDRSPWWGRRWRPAVIRERDYLEQSSSNQGDTSLAARVREKAAELGLDWREGAVCMLSQPRIFAWSFNPLTLFWHFPTASSVPDAIIAEVHNTPWNERHWYPLVPVASAKGMTFEHPKAFHVSPFMGMDMRYCWTFSQNDRDLAVTISNVADEGKVFAAGVRMQRQPADSATLQAVLRRYRAQSLKASLAIYGHALKLWWKGVGFHAHPVKKISD